MTAPTSPAELTGAYVRQVREGHKLSRNDFVALLEGPHWNTQTRLGNIEVRDSWKEGDREDIWAVLQRLTSGQMPTASENGDAPAGITDDHSVRAADQMLADHAADLTTAATDEVTGDTVFAGDPDWMYLPLPDDYVLVEDVAAPDPLLTGFAGGEVVAPRASFPRINLEPVDHVFTNSELQSWRRCRRQWWLAWYRKLTSHNDDRTGARATGDRVHRALAMWYVPAGEVQTDPRDALERVIVEDWTEIMRRAQEQGMDELRLGDLAKRFNDANMLERIMIEGYVEWLKETGADSELIITGPEQVVVAYMDVEEHAPVDSTPDEFKFQKKIALIGKIDARMERRSDGVRLFDDHKTAKDLTSKLRTLHGDPQMLTYHVLEWLQTEGAEERCDGALYTMLRKVKRTDRAKPPFYDRVEVRHNPEELETWKHELMGAMRDVMRAEEELRAGANPLQVVYRTWKDECSWDCDFFALCPMFNDGSRVEDAIRGLYTEGNPLERYDSAEVAAAVGGSVTDEEPKE